MDCRGVRRQLADFDAGALDRRPSASIEAHLAVCAECRRELAALRAVGMMVAHLTPAEPPAAIWQMIESRGARHLVRGHRRFGSLRLEWAAASAVMAVLLFMLSVVVSLQTFRPRPPDELLRPTGPAPVVQATTSAPMVRYFDQHAAASARDELADPVSMGLVTFVSDTAAEGPRR